MNDKYKPKPDDRSDNAEKLEEMIGDTLSKIDETEERKEKATEKDTKTKKKKKKIKNKKKPKPEDRNDNEEKQKKMIGDTLSNIDETEERMEKAPEKDKETLEKKNKRRKEAVEGFRDEIQDELEQ